jgi:alanine-glyoxylate transaminase/serine-glyoxylate transaminase/serine-pyruvate transaminase
LGHLDPQFLECMSQVQEMLRAAFLTKNALTLPISATGTAGMETMFDNLVEPGDKVAVFALGYFGQRMIDIAGRTGAEVTAVEGKWGEAFDLQLIRDTLRRVRPKMLGIVHAETSTGVLQPGMDEIGKMCRETDTLLAVDAVTSLGCTPLKVDEWGFDAVFSCSQKGLSCPPGLAPVSFSPRAVEVMDRRKTKVHSWYLDLSLIRKYVGGERAYHHTAPVNMNFAMHEGLRLLLTEGLEARWERHLRNHRALKAGLLAMGLQYTAAEGCQLPQLNAVRIPDGMDDVAGRKMMLTDFGIEIGGGLGDLKGRAWRIGLMGFNSRPSCVYQCLGAMERVLTKFGAKIPAGAGVAAANAAYAGMG